MSQLPKYKADGSRGSWFATVGGESLPCVHSHWMKGTHHCDPNYNTSPKFVELANAIESKMRVVLTNDVVSADERSFQRKEYVAVFRVENYLVDDSGLNFDIVERIAELQ